MNQLQSALHDFPSIDIERGDKVVEYTFLVNVASNNPEAVSLSPTALTSVFDWFARALNRPANGTEIYTVARQLYVTGRYAQAMAAVMLFRGDLEGIRVHGGGTDNLQVLHLHAHLAWKLGYPKQALLLLTEVMRERNQNSLEKSVHLVPSFKAGKPIGPTSFEESWQLLVEMGLDVYEGGEKKDNVVDERFDEKTFQNARTNDGSTDEDEDDGKSNRGQ